MLHKLILSQLSLGPSAIMSLCHLAPESVYSVAPNPDRFSFRADVAHLAELEPYFLRRIQELAKSDGQPIEIIDEDAMPGLANYNVTNPVHESEKFLRHRQETIAKCQELEPEQFLHSGHHPVLGDLSLADCLRLMIAHDLYHVEHMAGIMANFR